jgi:protein subunit release factor A
VEQLEGRIAELEDRQGELEKLLAEPDIFSDNSRGVPLLREYKALEEEQNELLVKWEKSQEKLEATRRELGISDG